VIRDGGENDLAARLAKDPLFAGIDLAAAMNSEDLAGRSSAQVEEFVRGAVAVALADCPVRAADAALTV
jgi:hypothetical protein